MYKDAKIAVVVPAHNEEQQIATVIDTMPDWVDHILVVDDASTDDTANRVRQQADVSDGRIELLSLSVNQGVGAAIEAGYRRAYELQADATAVMAGDGQMNPAELASLLDPIIAGEVDYTKGNRLLLGTAWESIPRLRLLGNAVLSVLTKIASGYWHIADSQNGYTAMGRTALGMLLHAGLYPRYGVPNDILVKLNVHNFRVRDIPMQAVYGVGETSKMKIPHVVLPITGLLFRRFFYRMWNKYIVRDTHPLVLFYLTGILLLLVGVGYGGLIVSVRLLLPWLAWGNDFAEAARPLCSDAGIILDAVLTLSGMQMTLFGMWFDMQHNTHLR